MSEIYVYAPDADDVGTLGLVGALMPTKAEYEATAFGDSVLNLTHPFDQYGKWKALTDGCLLVAEVPVRTTPEIDAGGQYVTSVEKWTVSSTATKAQRTPYTKAKGGKKKKVLAAGTTVIVTKKGEERYKFKAGKVSGWIAHEALNYEITELIPDSVDGIETVAPSYEVREQIFRISQAKRDRKNRVVEIVARPILYDLAGNITMYKNDEVVSAQEALDGIFGECLEEPGFEAYTDMADTRTAFDALHKNPVQALLDPEEGFVARWGCEMVFDDYELYLLKKAGTNRGTRIEYKKNLTALQYERNRDNLITRVMPIGTRKNGETLYLSDDESTDRFVDSPYINSYPTPRIAVLECSDAQVGDGVTVELARKRMREQAQAMFTERSDMPEINLTIEFINLGDTLEYAHLKGLENLYLYDDATIYDPELGVDTAVNVTRFVWDCVKHRAVKVELGSLKSTVGGIASWEIKGVNGGKIYAGSIGSGALGSDVIVARHISADTIEARHITSDTIETRHLQAESINTRALQAECITAEKISTVALYAQHIVAQVAEIVKAVINRADIGEAHIDYANIVDLKAIFATIANTEIGSAHIDYAKIYDLVAGTAIIEQGVGGKLFISRLAVTEANMGSLTVGELVVKGTDGRFYAVIVDADTGAVRTELKLVDGDDVEDKSLDAHTKIINGTITADELNVTQIFASEALIGKIKAAHIAAGSITTAHLASGFAQALDLSSNTSIRATVNADEIRAFIADGTRELRVSYDGAGTHFKDDDDTTTMTAKVYAGGFDITGTIPASAFIWTRYSDDSVLDAEWNAAHAGTRQVRVSKADVNNRSIIECTLLAHGDLALTFAVDPDTLLLTVTEPPYGDDHVEYDPETGLMTVYGEGYVYNPETGMIEADTGLSDERLTLQYTFSDETGVRTLVQQTKDTILLEVRDSLKDQRVAIDMALDRISLLIETEEGTTEFRLTDQLIAAMSQDINLNGRVTIGDLALDTIQKINAIESTANTANSNASGAASAAASARTALVNLCTDANMTLIKGSSISTDTLNTNNIYVSRLRDLASGSNNYVGLSNNPGSDAAKVGAAVVNDGTVVAFFGGSQGMTLSAYGYWGTMSAGPDYNGATLNLRRVTSGYVSTIEGHSAVHHASIEIPGGHSKGGMYRGIPVLECYQNMDNGNFVASVNGNLRYSGSLSQQSDMRLKRDIAPLNALWLLDRIKVFRFRYIADPIKTHMGVMAQDIEDAIEGTDLEDAALLDGSSQTRLAVDKTELIAPLVEAYHHQKAINKAQKAEINDLKSRLARLEQLLGVG